MKMMKAVEISEFGSPDVLRVVDRPIPQYQKGELLIEVEAAGINRPDVFQRKGAYAPPVGASDIPGLEVAGRVVDGDFSASPFQKGDKVCALVSGGGYAQYCTASVGSCLPIPRGWSVLEAASIPETFFTVWHNVFHRAHLQKSESLLVHGGTSGIGVAAIQMARAMGSKVIVTVGSDEKCEAAIKIGAHHAINYRTQDFAQRVLEITHHKGVDVILDMVAGAYLESNIRCLADDGRISIIALLGGAKGNLDMGQIMRRRLTITGSTLRPQSNMFKAMLAEQLHKQIWPLIEQENSLIRPHIDQIFSMKEVAQAHSLMESSAHIGKIMLKIDSI